MQDHTTGAIKGTRQGASSTVQSFVVNRTNFLTGINHKLLTIEASPTKPVTFRMTFVQEIAETTTGASALNVGNVSGGSQFLSGINLKTASPVIFTPTLPLKTVTVDTDIWAIVSRADSAGVTGFGSLNIEFWENNSVGPAGAVD